MGEVGSVSQQYIFVAFCSWLPSELIFRSLRETFRWVSRCVRELHPRIPVCASVTAASASADVKLISCLFAGQSKWNLRSQFWLPGIPEIAATGSGIRRIRIQDPGQHPHSSWSWPPAPGGLSHQGLPGTRCHEGQQQYLHFSYRVALNRTSMSFV